MAKRSYRLIVLLVMVVCAAAVPRAHTPPVDDTETVLSTHRVKPGMEDEYQKLLSENWSTLRKLDLVLEKPHLVVRGGENGKTYFVEIFTWKSHDAPDHVPPEVGAIWHKMNEATEARDGHRGIEFPEVHVVATE